MVLLALAIMGIVWDNAAARRRDRHADNCGCLLFAGHPFLFPPSMMGQRLQFPPSHSLSRKHAVAAFAFLRALSAGVLKRRSGENQYSESCCQKVYGAARFPSLVSTSSFLKVKSANLGHSS
jgi:hypothetical protein